MAWLNYHHLLYFWTVARLGSVTKACEELHLTQPAISAQLRTLERALGATLFERRGRSMVLTDTGRVVFGYADEIFALGRELQHTLAGRPGDRPLRFVVGMSDGMPKLVGFRLLEPAMALPQGIKLVLREDTPSRLLTELATHTLDLVLTDTPADPSVRVKVFSHLLGESGIEWFATPERYAVMRRRFPKSLNDAPWLAPPERTPLRQDLDAWCERVGVRPRVLAEIEDSAVLKTFGQAGVGVFAAPSVVADEVRRQFGVKALGTAEGVTQRFYAISAERRLSHPAVLAITSAARRELFA